MKGAKTNRERLVGCLGGYGGAAVLSAFTNYLLYPSWQKNVWPINLFFGVSGTSLIITAVLIHLKKIE